MHRESNDKRTAQVIDGLGIESKMIEGLFRKYMDYAQRVKRQEDCSGNTWTMQRESNDRRTVQKIDGTMQRESNDRRTVQEIDGLCKESRMIEGLFRK